MLKLNVRFDVQRTIAEHRKHQRQIKKAAARAINRAIDRATIVAGKEISTKTKIKVRDVRKRLSTRGATPERLHAELIAHAYAPNLAQFRATENKQGVAATAWEGRKTYKHAFINPKTQRVVTRTTDQRTPLKGLKGPSVRKTFMRDDVQKVIDKEARARFDTEFKREVERRLK